MNVLPVIDCTRITLGEINEKDRVFSPRIIAGEVAEKLHIPEEQILDQVFHYLKNLLSLGLLECSKIISQVKEDTAIWITPSKVLQFSPEFTNWLDSETTLAKETPSGPKINCP
jgi:hypothetical protein